MIEKPNYVTSLSHTPVGFSIGNLSLNGSVRKRVISMSFKGFRKQTFNLTSAVFFLHCHIDCS